MLTIRDRDGLQLPGAITGILTRDASISANTSHESRQQPSLPPALCERKPFKPYIEDEARPAKVPAALFMWTPPRTRTLARLLIIIKEIRQCGHCEA